MQQYPQQGAPNAQYAPVNPMQAPHYPQMQAVPQNAQQYAPGYAPVAGGYAGQNQPVPYPAQYPMPYPNPNAPGVYAPVPGHALEQLQGVYIKQKLNAVEAITQCEMENKYKVYPGDIHGKKIGEELFEIKEKSSFCQRTCFAPPCREFELRMKQENIKVELAEGEKECQCTFFCFNRSSMNIYKTANSQKQQIGKLFYPWTCCTAEVHVQDASGLVKYIIRSSIWQLGLLCKKMPFKSCQECVFDIFTPEGLTVAHLFKKSTSCCKACVSDASNFRLQFPPDCKYDDKLLLVMATIFVDYMFFEDYNDNNNNNSGIDFA